MKSRVAEPNLCSTSPPPRASRKTQFIQHPSRHQGPKGTDPTYPGPGPGELPFSDDEQALAQPKGPPRSQLCVAESSSQPVPLASHTIPVATNRHRDL